LWPAGVQYHRHDRGDWRYDRELNLTARTTSPKPRFVDATGRSDDDQGLAIALNDANQRHGRDRQEQMSDEGLAHDGSALVETRLSCFAHIVSRARNAASRGRATNCQPTLRVEPPVQSRNRRKRCSPT
jgi:hypothetical protein